MNPRIIEGIFKNSKDNRVFNQALMANGCHFSVYDKVYKLCQQGEFQIASQVIQANTSLY